jgi:hypothetical protein
MNVAAPMLIQHGKNANMMISAMCVAMYKIGSGRTGLLRKRGRSTNIGIVPTVANVPLPNEESAPPAAKKARHTLATSNGISDRIRAGYAKDPWFAALPAIPKQ